MDGDAREGDGRAERCRGGGKGAGEGEGKGGGRDASQMADLTSLDGSTRALAVKAQIADLPWSRSLCTRAGMSTYTCACIRVCGVH